MTKQQKAKPTELQKIEELTRGFADRREALAATVQALKEEQEAVALKYRKRLIGLVAEAKGARATLEAEISRNPDLFVKPRTITVQGVKVGFQKGKGKVEYSNADKVVELIEKHLAPQAEILVITEKKPNKEAIAQLDVADLRKIGCTVSGTGDQVVIKDAAGEIDKLVAALLKEEGPQE